MDKRQKSEVAPGEIPTVHRRKSQSESGHMPEQVPREIVDFLSMDVLKTGLDKALVKALGDLV